MVNLVTVFSCGGATSGTKVSSDEDRKHIVSWQSQITDDFHDSIFPSQSGSSIATPTHKVLIGSEELEVETAASRGDRM
jgi:hypothetical protein